MTTSPKTSDSPEIQSDFDIHDASSADSVYEQYEEMRKRCPVAHSTAYGGHWVLTRYEDVHNALRTHEVFSSESVNIPPSIGQEGMMIPLEIDPPDHTKYRQILNPLFSPKRMAELEGEIRKIVDELLDEALDGDRCEFITAFAKPLPTRVFLALLGWPQEDAAKLHHWTDTIVQGKPGASEEESTAVREQAAGEAYEYFANMIDARMEDPNAPEDVTSVLLEGKFDDRELTQFEILNICFLMMIAGLHTVQGQLAHSMIYLAENPDKRRELTDNLELVPAAVEELLRYDSPIAPSRLIKSDIEVGGVKICSGDRTLIPLNAANRDPEQFDKPDEVDFTREPNPHLAFGGGRHRCLGSHLARLELRIAMEQIHQRIPDYKLDPSDPPLRHLSQVKGVERLALILGESA